MKEQMKQIKILESVKEIGLSGVYDTGEKPVLVMCSDTNVYICKYMRSSMSAYKLACEYIGVCMAEAWNLGSPDIALVKIKQNHWEGTNISHVLSAPAIGSKKMEGVADITPFTYGDVKATDEVIRQMLKIALFDFWIANEDRNSNNANLLYNVNKGKIIPIDYGCIFNTSTFDFPMSQLTTTDTILCSDLFHHLLKGRKDSFIDDETQKLRQQYKTCIKKSEEQQLFIINNLPQEWKVPSQIVAEKIAQLFDEKWVEDCWNNFEECLNYNRKNEEF